MYLFTNFVDWHWKLRWTNFSRKESVRNAALLRNAIQIEFRLTDKRLFNYVFQKEQKTK
jgi:hypothetical protein